MPIYEWRCASGHDFEMLVSVRDGQQRQRCPRCGAKASRMISTFAIHDGASVPTAAERAVQREIDVTRLKVPAFARPCAMDDYSAARLAAHKVGRGAEFDDKISARNERQAAAGKQSKKPKRASGPRHSH